MKYKRNVHFYMNIIKKHIKSNKIHDVFFVRYIFYYASVGGELFPFSSAIVCAFAIIGSCIIS